MEEKERYVIDYCDDIIFDTEKGYYPSGDTICKTLNQQDKRVKELEQELDDAKRGYIPKLEFGLKRANKMGKQAEQENQQLKQQLAESEKALEAKESVNRIYKATLALKDSDFSDLVRENAKLKQQLHDLPKKIVEEIKLQLFNHFKVKNIEEYEKLPLIDSLFTADTVIEILDTILKKYGGKDE